MLSIFTLYSYIALLLQEISLLIRSIYLFINQLILIMMEGSNTEENQRNGTDNNSYQ